jgi:transposase
MKRIPRRLFTEEFKREAIKLVTEQHLNVAAAGRQLDVDPKSIRSWIAESERGELKATLGSAKLTLDQQRIRELERELAIAREERDILKTPRSLRNSRSKVRHDRQT